MAFHLFKSHITVRQRGEVRTERSFITALVIVGIAHRIQLLKAGAAEVNPPPPPIK